AYTMIYSRSLHDARPILIEGFMAQGGDPTGTGMGGSQYPDLPAEFNDLPHVRGVASMARAANPNSANSQFFICFQPSFFLDGQRSEEHTSELQSRENLVC